MHPLATVFASVLLLAAAGCTTTTSTITTLPGQGSPSAVFNTHVPQRAGQ